MKNEGPTLTKVTYIGRQGLKVLIVLLISLMVGRTLLNAFTSFWKATHPPEAAPPTLGFGVLPAIEFPKQKIDDKPKDYELETKTGGFPQFEDQARVFFMPGFSASLLDDEAARQLAASFSFVLEPEVLNERTYRFTKTQPVLSTLDVDIRSRTFDLKTNYFSRPDLLLNQELPDTETAVSLVKSSLRSAGIFNADLEEASSSAKAAYVKTQGSELVSALTRNEAEFIEVDLVRAPIDDLPIYTQEGEKGTVHAIVSGAFSGKDAIARLSNFHYPIEYNQYETYPLRSVSNAWSVLESGEGYIASKGNSETAVIRHIYLAYYDSFEYQEYFRPIYVFEGDGGFLGYVSAVDPKYVE